MKIAAENGQAVIDILIMVRYGYGVTVVAKKVQDQVAVSVEDMIYLKIVNAMPGKLILSSANPAYAPIEADTRDQLGDLVHIIGRAVWVGRELE